MPHMIPCAHCGEPLPDDAIFCRHCGSDFETGWSRDVDYNSVEIPDYLTEDATPERQRTPLGRNRALISVVSLAWIAAVTSLLLFDAPEFWQGIAAVGFAIWMGYVFFGETRS